MVAGLLFWESTLIHEKYQKTITQNAESPEEETALRTAEALNYSSILSKERFLGSTDPNSYLHPGTYLTYTYANFVDTEVIAYYTTRYDNLQGKGKPGYIELSYQANSTKRSEFQVFKSPPPEGVNWHNTTIVISSPDGSLVRKDSSDMQFFYRNQTDYQMTEWEYSFNFSNCHVIEMKLTYSEVYAPTAGFFVDVEQIVVLDKDFKPVLVGVESGMAVS